MKYSHNLLLSLFLFLSSCCVYSSEIILEEPDFSAKNKILVYDVNSMGVKTGFVRLRGELRKKGIKILKYASNQGINIKETQYNSNEKNTDISNFANYDSVYVLDAVINKVNDGVCPTNPNVEFYDILVEITNLETKEVVFSAKVKSADRPCAYCHNRCFVDMAEKISEFWNRSQED